MDDDGGDHNNGCIGAGGHVVAGEAGASSFGGSHSEEAPNYDPQSGASASSFSTTGTVEVHVYVSQRLSQEKNLWGQASNHTEFHQQRTKKKS